MESQLKESKAKTINNIEMKDIEAWKELILKIYNNKKVAQYDLIEPKYIYEILEELEKYIKKINLR